MQISGINTQKVINGFASGVTNPIKKAVEKGVSKNVALGVGAAAVSGAYVVSKSAQDRQERIDILKSTKINDETANKILNLKNEAGDKVFGKREIKALAETEQLDDKTFFSRVMKNIDNVDYFDKHTDSKKGEVVYEFNATTTNGTIYSAATVLKDNTINTDTIIDDGKYTTNIIRTWSEDSVDERVEKTEKITRRTGTKKHPGKKVTEEKVISSEDVSWQKANNKFKRTVNNTNTWDYPQTTKITKFDYNGVINNTTSTEYDLSKLQDIKSRKIKKEDLENIAGRELTTEEYKNMMKKGDIPFDVLEKIMTNKSLVKDYANGAIINANGGVDRDQMTSQTRTYTNPRTGRKETIKMEKSPVAGVYNSTITDDLGNTRVESKGTKDIFGNIKVEKNFESLDGTQTHYTYSASKNENNIKMHYQIKDANGKVLTTVDRTFNRVNPNLAYSSINGHSYKIEKKEKSYEVTDNLTGKTTAMKFKDLFKNNESRKHPEIFDKMSGDMLIDMYNRNYKLSYTPDALESYMDDENMIVKTKDDLFVFAHEQGHTKDIITEFDEDYSNADKDADMNLEESFDGYVRVSTNPLFRKAYEQERADFMKAFPDIEQGYIDYFINRVEHYGGYLGGAMETVAESNALMSTGAGYDVSSARGYYLQKFFPRTIATLSHVLMPNSNIYVTDGQGK